MLQLWVWLSSGKVYYGKADGMDLPSPANDAVMVNVLNKNGVVVLRCSQGELRKLASFQGYTNPDNNLN